MTEKELADKFTAELDRKLSGAKGPDSDPMLKMAGMLAGTDFSSDSRVRDSLRARLMAKRAARVESFWSRLREAIVSPHPAWAAGAACVLVLAVAGLLHQPSVKLPDTARQDETAAMPTIAPVPDEAAANAVAQAVAPAYRAVPAAAGSAGGQRKAQGVFVSLPAVPLIETREISPEMLRENMTGDSVMRSVPGQLKGGDEGESISWDTDDGTLILEHRAITADTIFERRTI